MPIMKVVVKGKPMYKWGESGKLYPTKEQAITQSIAIRLSQERQKKKQAHK